MTSVGQIGLLIALVGSGYAAFACIVGGRGGQRAIVRGGVWAALASAVALTGVAILLARALLIKDFRFEYVAQYSDAALPWHYSLSAFWVGQAGSLLLWAWFVAVLAVVYRFTAAGDPADLRDLAFGTLMAYLCFLVAIMVFSADPMQPSLVARTTGSGLSPLLQHPAMLVHPPIVFLGYAAWGVPFALAVAALASGRLDNTWVQQARPWALAAWTILGGGILWGADWAYEELGWGGYWNWDPVENGSLMPWLTGTAFLHCLMAWKYTGTLKKTALALAVATFGLCNFATFVTRSGIFSSLHAFSQSPIGWMFLAWMAVLAVGGAALVVWRRGELVASKPMASLGSREASVLVAGVALLLLTAVTLVGTLSVPLSDLLSTARIVLGPAFYNHVLMPTGLILLGLVAAAPLLRWGLGPAAGQRKLLAVAGGAGAVVAASVFALGVRHPIALGVAGLAAWAVATTVVALIADARGLHSRRAWLRPLWVLAVHRRRYAGFLIHLGFVSLAIGIAGSSLGTRQQEIVLKEGDSTEWAGRHIRYAQRTQRDLPHKSAVEILLEVSEEGATYTLRPALCLYRPQNQWTTEVAIHSTWREDFYVILHGREDQSTIGLTLIENPLMRWLWAAGWISAAGALIGLWGTGRGQKSEGQDARSSLPRHTAVPRPHQPSERLGACPQTTCGAGVSPAHAAGTAAPQQRGADHG